MTDTITTKRALLIVDVQKEGDPAFEVMMRTMETGEIMSAHQKPDGTWDVQYGPPPGEKSSE